MARTRKEKGQPSTKPKSGPKEVKNKIPKDHVLNFGGNKEDAELLKNVDENIVTGSANADPSLATDVSQFLKDLNLKGDTDAPKSSGKGKDKSQQKKGKPSTQENVSKPEKPSKKDSKKEKKDKKAAEPKEAPAAAAPAAKVDEPKVVLPNKISLNSKSHFVFQPISQWYNALPPLKPVDGSTPAVTPSVLSELSSKAEQLHDADVRTFVSSSSSNASEASFLAKIIQSGTLSDRLSALTLLVQSSPLHNTKALETLKTMAERGKGKGGREESLKALRCIADWWVGGGAPGRKLKYFRDQPLTHPAVTDEYLLAWYFEDWLKKYFFSILQILENLSLDPLPYVRTQTINLIFTLLRDKPEQEQNLLRLLVNKLGDTEKSLASRASYHLLQLLQTHPAMKGIIVREIINLVLRPQAAPAATTASAPAATTASAPTASTGKHIRFTDDAEPSKPKPKPTAEKKIGGGNAHARYYSTVTFNQIVLTPADRPVALQLIDVYFEIFKELLGEGAGEEDADNNEGGKEKEGGEGAAEEEVKVDKGGRVLEKKRGGKGKGKGKQMEVKGAAGFTEVEDSNSKLISAILTGVNRALPFAKIDASDVSINKHIDTLFLITHQSTFNISLQALVLIQQISTSLSSSESTSGASSSSAATAKSIVDRYYRTLYASLFDTRLAASSKQAMYLNLFFKSVKADVGKTENNERVKALIRRFVQVLVSGGGGATEFVAGGLFLLGELFSSIPGLRSIITQPPKETDEKDAYDPRKREPQYAHASSLPLWELTVLVNHYHPAVSLHARQLLAAQPLTASADLSQNTLSHFLDRFVYKNPKKVKDGDAGAASGKGKGASAMQPAASAVDGVKLLKGEVADATMVNEAAFLKKKRQDVPVDQLFFYDYFTRKNEREKARLSKANKKKEGKEDESDEDEDEDVEDQDEADSDEEEDEAPTKAKASAGDEDEEADSDASDADEDEIWRVMQATMPKADGDDDLMADSDVDIDDDESLDMGSDSDEDAEIDDAEEEADEDEDEDAEDLEDDAGRVEDDSDGDDGLSLVEDSDNEDLISLDGDMPDGLIEYDGSDASDVEEDADAEWGGITPAKGSKRKRDDASDKKEKRKKLRSLPTFASYEDYAKMIEDGPEDYI